MTWTGSSLADRTAIVETMHRYGQGIDFRNWGLFRSVFCDRIIVDFTSWHGGDPLDIDADEWVRRVAARQSGFDSTQHAMSNHVVTLDGNEADCTTYIVARHCLRRADHDELQCIGGNYANRMIRADGGWKIRQCTLNVMWTRGDRQLFDEAARRHAERTGDVG